MEEHRERLPGSPPRVRGKDNFLRQVKELTRITPACAGKSAPVPELAVSAEDHPRVCGEKGRGEPARLSRSGSPPRVRGKGGGVPQVGKDCGITPACAGKSPPTGAHGDANLDHPRVCGEKALQRLHLGITLGSPPRVRGKVPPFDIRLTARGITPACAGKSQRHGFFPAEGQDHPRVCGEKRMSRRREAGFKGSPPRVRGKD